MSRLPSALARLRAVTSSSWRRRLGWLTGVSVVGIVALAAIAQDRRYTASLSAVQQTVEVQQAIAETLSLLKDAETGQRGFLLTGDAEFLVPYEKARRELPGQFMRLPARIDSVGGQTTNAQALRRVADQKLEELALTVRLRTDGRGDEALARVRQGRGRRLMDSIRAEAAQMLDDQAALLHERAQAAALGRQRFTEILAGSSGLLLCLAIWGIWSAARRRAEAKRSHELLQESEKALRAVVDNATDLVRIIGNESELLYVSPSCQRILGYSQAEMLAMAPRALLPEDEREAALALTERLKAGSGSSAPFIHRLRSKDGTFQWFETTYCLVRDTGNAHIHLMSRDITRRKNAEDDLRRQTARLESILSSMGDGVVVLDQERRLLVVNPVARHYILQNEGETVPTNWHEQRMTFQAGSEASAVDQGPFSRALRGEACDGVELTVEDRRGMVRSLSVTSRPLFDAEAPAGCVAVYRDITEQRRAEDDLRESEQRLRVLSEASFEGVAISRDGIIVDTNANLAGWLGRKPYEIVGVDEMSLFAPEDHASVRERSSHSDVLYEAHLLRQDGSRLPVEVRGRHMALRGQTVRIAAVRDITDRRRRELELKQQAELMRSMSLRDELTALYNRRGFQEHAEQQLRAAVRTRRSAAVFFIDLNGMKSINDTYGHEAGDRALISTAKALSKVFRASDIVARLGGDEFATFALECESDGVRVVRERLARYVDDVNRDGGEAFRLSLSVGSAIYEPSAPVSLQDLLEAADRHMYEEKRTTSSSTRTALQGGTRAMQ